MKETPKWRGMDRFQTGKSLALRSAEIKESAARITRRFKAGQAVDMHDLEVIQNHVLEMRMLLDFWNRVHDMEDRKVIRTK